MLDSNAPKLEEILEIYLNHKNSAASSSSPLSHHSIITFRSNESSTISSMASDSPSMFSESLTDSDINGDSPVKSKKRTRKSKNEEELFPSSKRLKNNA